MKKQRIYKMKDVEMLLASRTIADTPHTKAETLPTKVVAFPSIAETKTTQEE